MSSLFSSDLKSKLNSFHLVFLRLSLLFILSLSGMLDVRGQDLRCPDFGQQKIIVENDPVNSYSYPQIQTHDEDIFVSGDFGTYDDDWNYLGKYEVKKINKAGEVSTIIPNLNVIPKVTGEYCSTTIQTKILKNGNIFVTWYSGSSSCSVVDNYYKILNQSGAEIFPTTKLNTGIYKYYNNDTKSSLTSATRRFDLEIRPWASVTLNRNVQIEQLSNGTVAVVYATDGRNYAMRRFTPAGQPIDANELSITSLAGLSGSQYTHNIAANDKEQFMIFIDSYSINYRVFLFDNEAIVPLSRFNIAAGPSGKAYYDKNPNVKALPNGKFLLAYQKNRGSNSDSRSAAYQIVNPDGSVFKAEEIIKTYYSWGDISDPIVTNDGFLLQYSYNDLGKYGSMLGYIPYLELYNFEGNKI